MRCPTCDKTMQLAAHDENGVTVSLCFEYQGGSPRVRAIFGLADHPTRRYVRRIILVFKGERP